MGFFNSNKNRTASIAVNSRGRMRSPMAQNRRMLRMETNDHINGARSNNNNGSITETVYMTKKQIEAQELGFLGYSLKYGNIMLVGNIDDMLPQYKQDDNIIRNNIFNGIKCDKVGIVYSPKKKQFMYLTLNDNYTIGILFKNEDINQLPGINNIDLDNLEYTNIQILENINRLIVSVYYDSELLDLTYNPICNYKITEFFKK